MLVAQICMYPLLCMCSYSAVLGALTFGISKQPLTMGASHRSGQRKGDAATRERYPAAGRSNTAMMQQRSKWRGDEREAPAIMQDGASTGSRLTKLYYTILHYTWLYSNMHKALAMTPNGLNTSVSCRVLGITCFDMTANKETKHRRCRPAKLPM